MQQKTEAVVSKTLLEYYEDSRITLADIVLESNGSIQVVTSTGNVNDPVRLHKVTIDVSTLFCA